MIKLLYISFLILGAGLGLGSVFSGSGHTRSLLYSSIASLWFMQIPFLFSVVYIFHLPLFSVWISYILSEVVEYAVIFYHYKKNKWCTKRV